MTKGKNCCLKEWEREAICRVCKAKAADIGREYLSDDSVLKTIKLRDILNNFQYIVDFYNIFKRRWERYVVCFLGQMKLATFKPPKSPLVGAGY